jgi:ubiquitin C-terminal hydrolase
MNICTKGIRNIGNTCYMGSAVQCLLSCDVFNNYINTFPFPVCLRSRSPCELMDEFVKFVKSEYTDVPKFMTSLHNHMSTCMDVYEQNDIQEFMVTFIDKLCKSVGKSLTKKDLEEYMCILDLDVPSNNNNKAKRYLSALTVKWYVANKKEYSPLTDMFYGQQVNQLKCNGCRELSQMCETFAFVPLCFEEETTNNNITQMIDLYMQSHITPARTCDACHKQLPSEWTSRFSRMPSILIVFIKRFDESLRKITTNVTVDDIIDLKQHVVHTDIMAKYRLKAIACHCGSMNNGHYYAITRSKNNNGWNVCDDENVTHINDFHKLDSSHFYMMLYESLT